MTEDHIKWLWVLYKKGGLELMDPGFADKEMDPAELADVAVEVLDLKYDEAWLAFLGDDERPVGLFLAFWPHRIRDLPSYMVLDQLIWFPWATPRAKVETFIHFWNEARKEVPMMGFSDMESKKFYETACKHGIMRRIGTSMSLLPGRKSAVFETRDP